MPRERGINAEAVRVFGLGFSPNVSGSLVNYLRSKEVSDKTIERAGLAFSGERGLVDRFRGRVIFPITDNQGRVIALTGRILPKYDTGKMGKYINSPETPIYHKSSSLYGLGVTRRAISKVRAVVVVEGDIDLISSWQNDIKNVVAIKGTALTSEQIALLSRYADEAVLALDSDSAGDAAAMRGIMDAQASGMTIKVARMGKYKDPDNYVREDLAGYKNALSSAVDVWEFMIDFIFEREDARDGVGKRKISAQLGPLLSKIIDPIVSAHYMKQVAARLDVPVESVAELVGKQQVQVGGVISEKREDIKKSRRELLEARLFTLSFLVDPEVLITGEVGEMVKTPFFSKILMEFRAYMRGKKSFKLSEFSQTIPAELREGFSELVLSEDGEVDLAKEMEEVKHELKTLGVREQLEAKARLISELEGKKGKRNALRQAQRAFSELSSEVAS